jgi:hypothetical protein
VVAGSTLSVETWKCLKGLIIPKQAMIRTVTRTKIGGLVLAKGGEEEAEGLWSWKGSYSVMMSFHGSYHCQ